MQIEHLISYLLQLNIIQCDQDFILANSGEKHHDKK